MKDGAGLAKRVPNADLFVYLAFRFKFISAIPDRAENIYRSCRAEAGSFAMLKVIPNCRRQCLAVKMIGTKRRTRPAVLGSVRITERNAGFAAQLVHEIFELAHLV